LLYIDLLDDFKEQIEEIFEEVKKGLQSELPYITSGTERIEVIIRKKLKKKKKKKKKIKKIL